MTAPSTIPATLRALASELAVREPAREPPALEPLRDKGLAHDHVRLVGTGLIARIPKQSQLGLAARQNLDHQANCFRRAAPGGHVPTLVEVLAPSAHLPRGALIVEEIVGQPARLPGDLPAIVRALASLHALPVPESASRAPLASPEDALAALATEIGAQARHLPDAGVTPTTAHVIEDELERLVGLLATRGRPPVRLIAFDGHPGNFVIRADGHAILVDLEKCRYSAPALDLAHATLYTSTTWDLESHAVLDIASVRGAYEAWDEVVGAALADAYRPWHVPLRRAMWLWSLTWCAKWRALSGRAKGAGVDGEDWSAERSDEALVMHVRERTAHYLSPDAVERVRAECDALERVIV